MPSLPYIVADAAKKGYYVDNHEDKKIVESRNVYIEKFEKLEKNMAVWVSFSFQEFKEFHEKSRVAIQAEVAGARRAAELSTTKTAAKNLLKATERHMAQAEAWKWAFDEAFFYTREEGGLALKSHPPAYGWHWMSATDPAARSIRVELHVDIAEAMNLCERKHLGTTPTLGGSRSVRFDPTVSIQIIVHLGQDEAIFKQWARASKAWTFGGAFGLRKKTDGPGLMISAFQDEHRGFGLSISDEELQLVNANRAGKFYFSDGKPKPPLTESPGIRTLDYGKNKDGYWNYDMFALQVEDLLDVVNVVYEDQIVLIEVDHSSGHARARLGGLSVRSMGLKRGGMQASDIKSEKPLTAEDLGPYSGNGVLQVGDIQYFNFGATDNTPKPISDPDAPKHTTVGGRVEHKVRNINPAVFASTDTEEGSSYGWGVELAEFSSSVVVASVSDDSKLYKGKQAVTEGWVLKSVGDCEPTSREEAYGAIAGELASGKKIISMVFEADSTIHGYLGQPKGKMEIALERGLLDVYDTTGKVVKKKLSRYSLAGKLVNGERDLATSIDALLASCADFAAEVPALQHLVEKEYKHLLIMSPKCHPELAGGGIEYSWGRWKKMFRRSNHYQATGASTIGAFHKLVWETMTVLDIDWVRKSAAVARRYKTAYRVLRAPQEDGPVVRLAYSVIEKTQKKFRAHRCAMDFASKFCEEGL